MKTIVAHSDCQQIIDSEEFVHIRYTDVNDFADMVYSVPNPPVNEIRLRGMFFHERFPEESEAEEMSGSDVVKVSGSVKKQKQLILEPIPYHMLEIIKLIFLHNYIEIEGKRYIKEENTEVQVINVTYPFVTASVFLTELEDSYMFNVYSKI